jgi:hypothetical protein
MAKLFGFSIDDSDDKLKSKSIVSPVPPNNDDGVDNFISSGFYGQYLDIEGVYRTEFDLIKRYREMALHPECDNAIEDVVNEAIVSDLYDSPVEIELSNLNASDKLKDKIREEFRYIKELLDFDRKSHEIFRNWYVDGKLYYLKVIDIKKPQDGIQDLRYIDPMKMKYVRQEKKRNNKNFINVNAIQETDKVFFPEVEEFYMYSPTSQYASGSFSSGGAQKQIKIAKDSITYVTSGLVDRNKGTILSYLHKSIKALNQLRMIEDSLVIYRLSRAPERRIFYIDVGNLPKVKAEQYLKEVMSRYRNKLVYDACLSMDTRIPLLNGQTLTLSEITDKFNKGERLWTYSCDPNTGKFAPGLISWSGVTRKNEKVMKITLDNDKTIVCTLDHKFPVWNRGKVEAKDLQIGDSMIPFYSKLKQLSSASKNSTYEQIYENESKKWIYVHRLVSRWKDELNLSNEYNYSPQRLDEDKKTVHHMDYNRYNNTPENLVRMSRDDHFDYHKQHSSYSGKIGGKVCAQRKREMGIPFFNLTDEQRSAIGKRSGAIIGKKCVENKLGIHGLSKDEIIKNSKKGNKILSEKLKTDSEFRNKFCQAIKDGWGEEQRKNASERGKKIPKSHFVEMNKLVNETRWQGENSEEQRKNHSDRQTIEYTQQIFNLVQECVKNNYKFEDAIHYINENLNFEEWIDLNSNKNLRKGKGNVPLEKFNYHNLTNVCKKLGFNSWSEYKTSIVYKNHKIKNIEFLEESIDVGTLTIDKDEIYHNYHTFALDSGIYTCNSTGEVRDDKKFMSMMEDFWLPRREGGRGTEITTLPGGQNLGELSDIEYFQKKLYRALGVPESRITGSGDGFNLGRSSEILRDELKFSKFVGRLRKRFSNLFNDMLKTQLVLKNIVTPEDWDSMSDHIQYDYLYDNQFSELKDSELMTERLGILATIEPYIGKYYSSAYIRKKILRQTDTEIIEIDQQIKSEIKKGIIPDPATIDPITGEPLPPPDQSGMDQPMDQMPQDPNIDQQLPSAPSPKDVKKAEI